MALKDKNKTRGTSSKSFIGSDSSTEASTKTGEGAQKKRKSPPSSPMGGRYGSGNKKKS